MTSKTSVILSMMVVALAATGCSSKEQPTGSGGGGGGGGGGVTTSSTTTTSSSSTSSSSGSVPGCGDGIVGSGEQCDDGNAGSGDGCSADCQVEAGFSCTGTPSTCTCPPGAYLGCSGSSSVSCNASGDGTITYGCGAGGCIPSASGCGQCSATSCTAGAPGSFVSCDEEHGVILASGACAPTLGAASGKSECNGEACAECVGASVCGDGTTQGSKLDHAYTCSPEGKLGPATACGFGCDPQNGQCKDLLPASQAGSHLATGDAFTCSGPQDAALPAINVPPMSDMVIDTSTKTFTINAVPVSGVRWGAPYKPVGSGTTAIVAHVKSLSIGAVVTVTVTGANALILLVDQDVTASGLSPAAPTVISAAADRYLQAGPGAPSSAGGAGTNGGYPNSYGVGGAGHLGQGGKGGTGNAAGTAGGGIYGIAPMTALLEAGATGGRCSGPSGQNVGGRGGGALQISACGKIDLGANVIVNASGGGGQANHSFVGQGGGGGGSGGTLILEASVLAIAGALVSNGGGGGSGVCADVDGANWGGSSIGSTPVSTPASGGSCAMSTGGDGGAGTSVDGQTGSTGGFGGGGGGACGPIFLNVPPGTAPMVAAASPAPKVATACLTTNGVPPAACSYAP